MDNNAIMTPIIQYGFAGMCVVLLAMVAWMIKHLLVLLKSNQSVIDKNTNAIIHVDERTSDLLKIARSNEKRFLRLKCVPEDDSQ